MLEVMEEVKEEVMEEELIEDLLKEESKQEGVEEVMGGRGNEEMEGLMEVIEEVVVVGVDYTGGGIGCRGGNGGGYRGECNTGGGG